MDRKLTKKEEQNFINACKACLSRESIASLRSYGRKVGVAKPTEKKKEELIEEIIGVLLGKIEPIEQSKLGAPIKNDYVDPQLVSQMQLIQDKYLKSELTEELRRMMAPSGENFYKGKQNFRHRKPSGNVSVFEVQDPQYEEYEKRKEEERNIYCGQLQMVDGVAYLLPLTLERTENKICVPDELTEKYAVCEGDIVTCHAKRGKELYVAFEILTINYAPGGDLQRRRFEESPACYPTERVRFFGRGENPPTVVEKYFDWLIPVYKGQRGCIVAPPKAGKTSLVYKLAQSAAENNRDMRVFVLLLDQPPEVVMQFKKGLQNVDLLYTTYEDPSEKHVFAADFMLKRAKRFAECGHNVLLFVDSLNALARAYNEQDESSGGKVLTGGIESKTVYYLKKYFGAARCLEESGSLTLVGTVATETGNPADDFICAELSNVSNLEVRLSDELAKKRIYPSIDFAHTRASDASFLLGESEEGIEVVIHRDYLPKFGEQSLCRAIADAPDFDSFQDIVRSTIDK